MVKDLDHGSHRQGRLRGQNGAQVATVGEAAVFAMYVYTESLPRVVALAVA